LVWIFIGTFYQPLAAAILGFAFFFGRVLYSIGYCRGPKQRVAGAIICDLAFLGLFVLSIVSIAQWGKF
jgi:uncharacterized membrane protein YecN with MAPEG domain